jgi:hypothetical protein
VFVVDDSADSVNLEQIETTGQIGLQQKSAENDSMGSVNLGQVETLDLVELY